MLNRQAGLTLIETVLVLIVAALIIGGIWVAYSQMRLNQQVNDTVAVLDETLQVTRDYLSSQSAVPSNLSQALYNPAAGVSLMPTRLSYAYNATHTIAGNCVNPGTQIFFSPLGTEFFVQYPGCVSTNPLVKYFEVRIRFENQSGSINADQCLLLMPKIIGTMRIIQDRGLVGYWYGNASAWNSGIASLGGSGNTMMPLTQILPTSQAQYNNCTWPIDVRLYFAMRP